MNDFASKLPELLPRAIGWAEMQSREICVLGGAPLDTKGATLAKSVGAVVPEWIRIWIVPNIPSPEDPELLCINSNLSFIRTKNGGTARIAHGPPFTQSEDFR